MKLTPREQDRLTIFTMAELARKRRARGLKLNHPESVALICDELLEEARAGRPYAEVVEPGGRILGHAEVMEGIAEMIPFIQIEALFPDGSKLVTIHPANPMIPGEIITAEGPILANAGRRTHTLRIRNTSVWPIHVGSHHVFEANRRLQFDRAAAFGMRLDIPAGATVRWEPGEEKEVRLVEFAGARRVHGFNGLVDGPLTPEAKAAALARMKERGFM